MSLTEVSSAVALAKTLLSSRVSLVSFSARWCGPCKASRPLLVSLAEKLGDTVKTLIVYEADIGDALDDYSIDAFPTYVLFAGNAEQARVEGANMPKIEEMVKKFLASKKY